MGINSPMPDKNGYAFHIQKRYYHSLCLVSIPTYSLRRGAPITVMMVATELHRIPSDPPVAEPSCEIYLILARITFMPLHYTTDFPSCQQFQGFLKQNHKYFHLYPTQGQKRFFILQLCNSYRTTRPTRGFTIQKRGRPIGRPLWCIQLLFLLKGVLAEAADGALKAHKQYLRT